MRKRLVTSICLVTFLVACQQERPPASSATDPPSQPQSGGTLNRRLDSDVNTMNFVMHSTDAERNVLTYLNDPLIDLDANLQPIPATATSWDLSPDAKSFIFHLDPRATYSDGKPVRASDVVFTLRKIIEAPAPQLSGYFEGLDFNRTSALDEHTVQVVFDRARASQLAAFNIAVLPEHVYGTRDFNKEDPAATVIGNGPYKLARREPGQRIVLERREDYWRNKPWLQRIRFEVIPDDSVSWSALKLGQIDESRVKSDLAQMERNSPQVRDRLNMHEFYALAYNFFPWNNRDPLFQDPRARRAMTMCLDRESIVKSVYGGGARIMTGLFTADQWAFNSKVAPIPFDPQQAAAVLAEMGWRDSNGDKILDRAGRRFEFEMLIPAGNKISLQQSQIFQQELEKIGVRMRITQVDGATFFQRLTTGKYQTASLGWNLDPDPDPYALFHSSQFAPKGQNIVFFRNAEADRLIEQGREELDQQKRVAIYHRLHELLAQEQPYTWTIQVATNWGVNRRVQGVKESKGFGLFLWYPGPYDWWIPPDQRKPGE